MTLGPRERRRLNEIETMLTGADPQLADAFHRWWLPPEPGGGPDGVTEVSPWVGMTLLVAFASWIVGPVVGLLTAIAGLAWMAVERYGHLPEPQPARRPDGAGGWPEVGRWPNGS